MELIQEKIHMAAQKRNLTADHSPDITHFIRSIQRLEGNPDCFGMANGECDRLDCLWREYCLKDTTNHTIKA